MADNRDLRRYLDESGNLPSRELRRYISELQANEDLASRVSSELQEDLFALSERSVIGFAPVSTTRDAVPLDFIFVYVALDDYIPLAETPDGTPDSAVQEIIESYDHLGLLLLLTQLNRQCDRQEDLDRLRDYYRSCLQEGPRRRLDTAMSQREGPRDGPPRFVARVCVLAAMKELLRRPLDDGVGREQPELVHAIMLTHAFGSVLGMQAQEDGEMLGGIPANTMLYLVRNAALHLEDSAYASIDRTVRLWRDFAHHARRERLRAEPVELLQEATGLELEDLLAMGFALWAQANAWSPDKPLLMNAPYGTMPEERVELFYSAMGAGPEEFRITLRNSEAEFDFLPFEQKPVLELDNGWLVLDQRYLWARFTSGLFWFVNDHEKSRGGDRDSARWRRGYGAIVEAMVEDQLYSMAPTLLGGDRAKALYTEEDFERAYGEGVSRPDATIDMRHHMLMFEVQSGQLSKPTRVDGDVGWFKRDTRRLVLNKYHQLDSGGRAVLNDPETLTGAPPHPEMKILPFVVVGGGYPGEAISGSYVEDLAAQENLFPEEIGFGKAGILRPAELEMLEGLFERRGDIADLLEEWKISGLRNVSLWTFLIDRFSDHSHFRPTRMGHRVEATFDDLVARLGFRE